MKIAISAESTIDLSKELLQKYKIHTLPFTVLIGDEQLLDGEFDNSKIFNYVSTTKQLPKTSAVNEYQYEEYFTKLKEDCDAIIHISLSSELSSACSNARRVAEKMQNVYVVDSKSLSTGIALLAIYASKLSDSDISASDIFDLVQKRVDFVQASFVLERLNYLYKGGRCSALSLFGANLLKIRPQIILKNGKMGPHKKYRGEYTSCIKKYVDDTLAEFNNPDLSVAFVTYTTAPQEAIDYATARLKEKGFKEVYQTTAGATVTSHCGENTLGILYINDGKN